MDPSPRLNLDSGARLGSYEVLREIGRGGMSIVYEAKHVVLGKRAALKVLSSGALAETRAGKRFLREARIVAQLDHPHIVEAFDFGEVEGNPYLVMEILDGRDLAVVLQRRGRLALPELVEIFVPILSAVSSAHTAGVIHRDLKPSNVALPMRGGRMHPKVVDFGISKVLAAEVESVTHDDTILGTPQYLSPELTRGAANASPASDQYALGVMLYECATGQLPHQGKSTYDVMHAIVTTDAPAPSTLVPALPAAFDAIVARAMSRDVATRFPSVHALATALMALGDSGTQATWGAEFMTPDPSRTPSGESTLEEHEGRSSTAPRAFSIEEDAPRRRWTRKRLRFAIAAAVVAVVALYSLVAVRQRNARVTTVASASADTKGIASGAESVTTPPPPIAEPIARVGAEPGATSARAADAPIAPSAMPASAPPATHARATHVPAARASASQATPPPQPPPIATATMLAKPAAGPNGAPILE